MFTSTEIPSAEGSADDHTDLNISESIWADLNNGPAESFSGTPVVVNSEVGTLEVWENGDWKYTLNQNSLDHPDNDPSGAPVMTATRPFRQRPGPGFFKINVTDFDGDGVDTRLIININDDGPVAVEDADPITFSVEEDDMSLSSADPGPDQSEGVNEDGSDNQDEASDGGSASLASLFNIGADDDPAWWNTASPTLTRRLPELTSDGREISYEAPRSTAEPTP